MLPAKVPAGHPAGPQPRGRAPLFDPRLEAVLDRLHARGRRELASLIGYFLLRSIPQWLRGRRLSTIDEADMPFLRDKLISLARDKCEFCYLMCRALDARAIVEVGTSFGVSTLYLAAAARDNAAAGGNATVTGSEIDPAKAEAARGNLREAGLGDFAAIRVGDARQTLRDIAGPIDFLLIDSWIPLARPIIEMLGPRLRRGGFAVCDNTRQFRRDYRDYLDYIGNPVNGFRAIELPFTGGLHVCVRD